MKKICSKCKELKEFSEFYKCKYFKDGLQYKCKTYTKEFYLKNNKEIIKKCNKTWFEKNKERVKKQRQNYYRINIEEIKAKNKEYRKNNKETIKQRTKKWYINNIENVKEYKRKYGKNPKNKENANLRYKLRYDNDFVYRLNYAMGSAIYRSLKGNKVGRHWEDLVGYKLNDLKQHLEKQFKPDMNWNNYGKWHIDHIIPINLWIFESYNDIEFRLCWSLANLQPLWAVDNLLKGIKII